MERIRQLTEAERIGNALKAVENGRKAKQEAVLIDLRQHYKKMSRGFRGGNYGKR